MNAALVHVFRDNQREAAPAASATLSDDPMVRELTAEDYVRQVQAEPRDESWAGPTERMLEEDLRDKGAQLDFTTGGVMCRSASCFAELRFPSLRKAREDFKRMFGPPNRADCPLRVLYPTDGSDDAPVPGVLIADCREKRAREASGLAKPSP